MAAGPGAPTFFVVRKRGRDLIVPVIIPSDSETTVYFASTGVAHVAPRQPPLLTAARLHLGDLLRVVPQLLVQLPHADCPAVPGPEQVVERVQLHRGQSELSDRAQLVA